MQAAERPITDKDQQLVHAQTPLMVKNEKERGGVCGGQTAKRRGVEKRTFETRVGGERVWRNRGERDYKIS